jgi:hypothetical protein
MREVFSVAWRSWCTIPLLVGVTDVGHTNVSGVGRTNNA